MPGSKLLSSLVDHRTRGRASIANVQGKERASVDRISRNFCLALTISFSGNAFSGFLGNPGIVAGFLGNPGIMLPADILRKRYDEG